jgi:hypothetical protein
LKIVEVNLSSSLRIKRGGQGSTISLLNFMPQ